MDDDDFYGEDFENKDDDYEFEYEEEEQEFKEERGAFERAGATYVIGTSLKYTTNPIEKFKIIVDANFRKIKTTGGLSDGDLNVMMEKISGIHLIQYKNPSAYVLGYIASKGGKELSLQRFELAESLIPELSEKEDAITPPDIIRYAVFWVNL
jgi:hypothetical protein